MRKELDRRCFLAGAGAAFLGSLNPQSAIAATASVQLLATAYRRNGSEYGVMIFNENLKEVSHFSLPARGHDIAFNPQRNLAVAFARRPGNFALAFDCIGKTEPTLFYSPENRHFFGHGVFSTDSKLLYATENDFENGQGVIGIYDATDNFRRIGEFPSFGVGPHELLLDPQSGHLIVANGGIETHPDFGRAKLNIPTMEPSITIIEEATGRLIEKHTLPSHLHKLSIRHMGMDCRGTVFFGCQFEGPDSEFPPLVGSISPGSHIKLWNIPGDTQRQFANYVGSVAYDQGNDIVAVTLPKGNLVAAFDPKNGSVINTMKINRAFGVAATQEGLFINTEHGQLFDPHNAGSRTFQAIEFDNHIAG